MIGEPSEALRVAAAVGLPGRRSLGDPPALAAEDVECARQHRITGLLWRAIDDGEVTADDQVRSAARDATLAALRTCLHVESHALRAIRTIDAAGAESRLLKGVAIAHLDHADPAERVFGDCDLLVRRSQLPVVLGALQRAGWRREKPPVRAWWERRYGKGVLLYPPEGDGELDLHLSVTGGWFAARIDHDEIWARSDRFELAGTSVAALHPDDRLLQAACHTMLGANSGLRAERDVAQLILVTRADWAGVAERLRSVDAQLVLARAIGRAWSSLMLDPSHPAVVWATAEPGSAAQERALASYSGDEADGWTLEGRGAVSGLPLHERVLYSAGLTFPSRASLRHRGRTLPQHIRRVLRNTGAGAR